VLGKGGSEGDGYSGEEEEGKDKAVPDGEEQPIDDVYGASDGMEVDLYGLHSFGDEY